MKKLGNFRRKLFRFAPVAAGACALFAALPASAVSLTTADGSWTFSVDGNINGDLTFTQCANDPGPAGGLTCGGAVAAKAAGGGDKDNASVNTGLLPTAIVFGVATTQDGYDLKAVFGFYPGINSSTGTDPNGTGGPSLSEPLALQTAQIDTRQAFVTIGNKNVGTLKVGRDFGLFGFDAIINDMTIPGVGAAGNEAPAPGNTSLGSIGFGYIYTDTLAQIDYTTPSFGGLTITGGVFSPLNGANGLGAGSATKKDVPGVHEKIRYDFKSDAMSGFISSAGIWQRQTGLGADNHSGISWGLDVTGVVNMGPLGVLLSGYDARGLGTTGLFLNSFDGSGKARRSWGYLAQVTFKLTKALKLGANYGVSRLGDNAGDPGSLVFENSKVTLGAYWQAFPNMMFLAEATRSYSKSQDRNSDIASNNFNVGTFFSF